MNGSVVVVRCGAWHGGVGLVGKEGPDGSGERRIAFSATRMGG